MDFLARLILAWHRTVDHLIEAFERLTGYAKGLGRNQLAWGSLGLAAILLLSVNLAAGLGLRRAKLDLTQDQLFTISKGTRQVLQGIDEPISLKLYFSRQLGDAAPNYAKYFERVRTLLEQYRDIARGKLQVQFLNPEAFSDAEDRAEAAGLTRARINQEGETGFFGLTGSNSTDNEASIAFLSADRERFLEYDLTKLIWGLANPKKRIVGLVTSLPLDGGMGQMGRQTQPWLVMEQIREFFEVKNLAQDFSSVPKDVDVLMLVQPDGLTDTALYAIDQYALGGGRVLAFVDPVAESAKAGNPMMMAPDNKANPLDKLFKMWGVKFSKDMVAADIGHARRVQFGGMGRQPVQTEYVAWLGLDKDSLDQKDVLSGGIETLNLATPGFLEKADGANTTFAPILATGPMAMQVPSEKFALMPDPVGLLRAYKPGGKPLTLAARVTGDAKTAFPDGKPKPPKKDDDKKADGKDEKKDDAKTADGKAEPAKTEPEVPQIKDGKVSAIIVADSDMLGDQFWAEAANFLGQQVVVPRAHNAAFVVNALDNLSGSDALIALRGRGVDDRPFKLVDEIRLKSEQQYREKEEALQSKLKAVQQQLADVEKKGGEGGQIILSDKDKRTIEQFRREMLSVRGELRDVKLALRKDIDRLDGWLKFINIAGVPLLIGLGALYFGMRRGRSSGGKSGEEAA